MAICFNVSTKLITAMYVLRVVRVRVRVRVCLCVCVYCVYLLSLLTVFEIVTNSHLTVLRLYDVH